MVFIVSSNPKSSHSYYWRQKPGVCKIQNYCKYQNLKQSIHRIKIAINYNIVKFFYIIQCNTTQPHWRKQGRNNYSVIYHMFQHFSGKSENFGRKFLTMHITGTGFLNDTLYYRLLLMKVYLWMVQIYIA